MRKSLAIGAATVAFALSLGLAACGSSDDSSDNEDVLTNAELVSKADAICTEYNSKFSDLQDQSGLSSSSSKDEVVSFISDDVVPLFEDQVAALRELQPNDDDSEAYTEIVDTLDSEVQQVKDDPEAAVDQEDPFAGATAKAKDFGLKTCGSN
jgi:hypothetical protein